MKATAPRLTRRNFVSAASVAGAAAALGSARGLGQEAKARGTDLADPARPAKHVLLIVGENFEELEFAAFTGVLAWTRVYSFKGTPINVTVAGFDKVIGGMGSMRIVPDVLVGELTDKEIESLDAVAIPCSVGPGRGRRTGRGQAHLESKPVLDIVKRVHAKGGVIATMCCSRETLAKAGLLKPEDTQCRYWTEAKKNDASRSSAADAPIVVSNRIISTMGPAVSWQSVMVLIELLLGREQAADFVKTCPWVFGQRDELTLKVPVHHVTTTKR
ncbi:MAG: twin-arginine translocation signal domain-containing protein [Verrucomicrobia bacterium]|nr:twin-arginine translocation signal domain-containing protein [Verrucomicrobiota bacterium]